MTASHVLGESFKYDSLKINTIKSKTYVKVVSAVWETEGILKTNMEERIEPVLIKGISDSLKFKNSMIAGRFPTEMRSPKYDAEVALGTMLAQKLNWTRRGLEFSFTGSIRPHRCFG
ncbi:hypothetical protein CHS0354_023726 [Potamilus streckersoni]|uniref:Uncharacterized protein n=1 Tax=Potamilus streckersoni TaxID=2493646 RepID=A0AAE0RZH7_9BIVA|nr:hypothetical protein CHS0354_023726 [Potamilus streckersoni]